MKKFILLSSLIIFFTTMFSQTYVRRKNEEKTIFVNIISQCEVYIYGNWVSDHPLDVQLIVKNADKELQWIILYKNALQPPTFSRVIELEKELQPFQRIETKAPFEKRVFSSIDVYLPKFK